MPDGIPPALSEAWENQNAAPPVVTNTVRESDEELEEQVAQKSSEPKEAEPSYVYVASQNTEYGGVGEIDEESMHDAKRAENGDVDETKLTAENITERNIERNDTIKLNIQEAHLSDADDSSSSSSRSNGSNVEKTEDFRKKQCFDDVFRAVHKVTGGTGSSMMISENLSSNDFFNDVLGTLQGNKRKQSRDYDDGQNIKRRILNTEVICTS